MERPDHEIKLEVIVTEGTDVVAGCTEWNEIRTYENYDVLEISTDDNGAMIVMVEKGNDDVLITFDDDDICIAIENGI